MPRYGIIKFIKFDTTKQRYGFQNNRFATLTAVAGKQSRKFSLILSFMTPEAVFQFANTLVLPQWLLMIVAPRWSVTQWLMKSYLIPVCLAIVYVIYLFGGGPVDFGSFGSLAGVKGLFANGSDGVMLAGWVHYLAFDLVVGTVIVRDAQAKAIPHWLIIVPILFCSVIGPVGFLLYWIIRTVRTRTIGH